MASQLQLRHLRNCDTNCDTLYAADIAILFAPKRAECRSVAVVSEGVGAYIKSPPELCLKIREAGFLIVYTPYAKLYHYESKSRGLEDTSLKYPRAESPLFTSRLIAMLGSAACVNQLEIFFREQFTTDLDRVLNVGNQHTE